MKKILLALPLLAGASWAAATYYTGSQTEPAYQKLISQLNQLKPFSVESEQYDAGFITSTAITKVLDSSGPNASVMFRLKHVINHSPVGIDNEGARIGASSIVTTLMMDDITNPEVLSAIQNFEGGEPFELNTRVGLSGDAVNELLLNKYSANYDETSVQFDGGNFAIVSDGSGRVTGNGLLGALTVKGADSGDLAIQASPTVFDLQRVADGLYGGTYSFSMPSIDYSNTMMGMHVGLKDIVISSESRLTGENLFSDVSIKAAEINSPLPIDSLSWQLSIDDFSVDGLIKYRNLVSTMPMLGNGDVVDDADIMQSLDIMSKAYKALFTPGIGMNTGLVFTNSGGAVGTSVNVKYLGDGSASGMENISTIRDLLSAISISILLDADADALNQTPAGMLMMHPMASTYVLSDGVKYTTDIKVADLILDVNGDPQSLETMFGPMLDMPLDLSMLSQ